MLAERFYILVEGIKITFIIYFCMNDWNTDFGLMRVSWVVLCDMGGTLWYGWHKVAWMEHSGVGSTWWYGWCMAVWVVHGGMGSTWWYGWYMVVWVVHGGVGGTWWCGWYIVLWLWHGATVKRVVLVRNVRCPSVGVIGWSSIYGVEYTPTDPHTPPHTHGTQWGPT